MTPSFAFVGEPQTNGVVERFFRTLKEQVVHGRVFETLEDLRDAVRAFIARYNAQWLIEKNGHLSPHARRRQHELAAMPMAAYPTECPRNRVRFTHTGRRAIRAHEGTVVAPASNQRMGYPVERLATPVGL